MQREHDVIVLGLGGIGSGAAYWLARRGARVLGLEQFELGHANGGSQDHSRIIRLSYHDPVYVRLAKRAYEAWETLAADSGEQPVLETGGLDFGPRDGAIPLADYMGALDAEGVGYEHLQAEEIRRRWPQLTVQDDVHGIFQERGGIAKAAVGNAAHQRMAREHGAELRDGVAVTAIEVDDDGVGIMVDGTRHHAGKLVISAGAWSNDALAHLGVRLPLEVTQEQVAYYATPHLEEFRPGRFPVWIWMDEPSFYGFPVFGEEATKIAQDCGGRVVTAQSRSFVPDADNLARVEEFARRVMPRALGPVLLAKTCLYTLTPDRDFVIDRLPQHPNVLLAIGAGHAYKFASVIGRVLSELALDGRTPSDIEPFRFSRPILHMANPPRSYMV